MYFKRILYSILGLRRNKDLEADLSKEKRISENRLERLDHWEKQWQELTDKVSFVFDAAKMVGLIER